MSIQAAGSSNVEKLHGQQEHNYESPTHSDAEPLAQADNLRTGTTDSAGDSDYLPSNPLTAADEETEHGDGEEDAHQPVRLRATTSRSDDWLHLGPWLHSLAYFVYVHNVKRIRKSKASRS